MKPALINLIAWSIIKGLALSPSGRDLSKDFVAFEDAGNSADVTKVEKLVFEAFRICDKIRLHVAMQKTVIKRFRISNKKNICSLKTFCELGMKGLRFCTYLSVQFTGFLNSNAASAYSCSLFIKSFNSLMIFFCSKERFSNSRDPQTSLMRATILPHFS